MEIKIDTKKDSDEDIRKTIRFLQTLIGESNSNSDFPSNSSNIFNNSNNDDNNDANDNNNDTNDNNMMNMFGDNDPQIYSDDKDDDSPKVISTGDNDDDDVQIIPY